MSLIDQMKKHNKRKDKNMEDNDYWQNYGQFSNYTGGTKGGGTTWKSCDHYRTKFDLGDGNFVYLSSSSSHYSYKGEPVPVDMGVYLDSVWESRLKPVVANATFLSPTTPKNLAPPQDFLDAWDKAKPALPLPGVYLKWADRGVPSLDSLQKLLAWMNPLIDKGTRFEVGCIGGHGRTGTLAAALLASRSSMKAQDCIDTVRKLYCDKAIESIPQEDIIFHLKGEPLPEVVVKPKPTATPYKPITPNTPSGGHTSGVIYLGMTTVEKKAVKVWFGDPQKAMERLALNWSLPILLRKEIKQAELIPADQVIAL